MEKVGRFVGNWGDGRTDRRDKKVDESVAGLRRELRISAEDWYPPRGR